MKDYITNQKRILVIEDEAAIRRICQRVLADDCLEVDVAADGKVAKDMIEERQYDL